MVWTCRLIYFYAWLGKKLSGLHLKCGVVAAIGYAPIALADPRAGAVAIAGVELLRRIHKDRFALNRLRLKGQAAPAIWMPCFPRKSPKTPSPPAIRPIPAICTTATLRTTDRIAKIESGQVGISRC
jgi:hypothetical protein